MFVRYTFTLNVGGYSTEYDELSILTKKWFETLSRAYISLFLGKLYSTQ